MTSFRVQLPEKWPRGMAQVEPKIRAISMEGHTGQKCSSDVLQCVMHNNIVPYAAISETFRSDNEYEYEYEILTSGSARMRCERGTNHASNKLVVCSSLTTRFWIKVVVLKRDFKGKFYFHKLTHPLV